MPRTAKDITGQRPWLGRQRWQGVKGVGNPGCKALRQIREVQSPCCKTLVRNPEYKTLSAKPENHCGRSKKEDDTGLGPFVVLLIRHSPVRGKRLPERSPVWSGSARPRPSGPRNWHLSWSPNLEPQPELGRPRSFRFNGAQFAIRRQPAGCLDLGNISMSVRLLAIHGVIARFVWPHASWGWECR
jgi:hypothetical protein